jgi:SAM-dependent methyltransferase
MTCIFCGSDKFIPMGNRPKARCENCGSLERHRDSYKYITEYLRFANTVLHVAPEKCISDLMGGKDYRTLDKNRKDVTYKSDLEKIGCEDDTFDLIICFHVLEHVTNDLKAIDEIYRVLKKGGKAIIGVPVKGSITVEGIDDGSDKEREQFYGQFDHVRQYGQDFIMRLKGKASRIDNGIYVMEKK